MNLADTDNLNLTKQEFLALSKKDQEQLINSLPSTCAAFYSETNRNAKVPETPCVVDGVLIFD